MTLNDWRKAQAMTIPRLSSLLGMPINTVRSYLYGHRRPRPPEALRIADVTEGAVTIRDFYDPRP